MVGRFRHRYKVEYIPVDEIADVINNHRYVYGSAYKEWDYDKYTEEEIIPFDDSFTKISADSDGMYFKLFMQGLQPERYYRLLFKHINNDGTTIYDNKYLFKVIR